MGHVCGEQPWPSQAPDTGQPNAPSHLGQPPHLATPAPDRDPPTTIQPPTPLSCTSAPSGAGKDSQLSGASQPHSASLATIYSNCELADKRVGETPVSDVESMSVKGACSTSRHARIVPGKHVAALCRRQQVRVTRPEIFREHVTRIPAAFPCLLVGSSNVQVSYIPATCPILPSGHVL